MEYDVEKYESAINSWFAALKDIPTNDLLRQHINKYPEKKDFEIKEEKDENEENHT